MKQDQIQLKRIYEPASDHDGFRILVDRLWPRGLTKEAAQLDKWLKEVAPSHDLRKWFHSDEGSWEQFVDRYRLELKHNDAISTLTDLIKEHGPVTLLYAVHNSEQNHAIVLREYLLG